MSSLGIDLGKHGGIVLLDRDGGLRAWARTPLAGKQYDGLKMHRAVCWMLAQCPDGDAVRGFVEQPAVFNLMNSQAAAVGEGAGRWVQTLEINGVPWQFVPAQTWVPVYAPKPKRKRDPNAPKETAAQQQERRARERKASKERLLLEARRRFPTIPWDSLNKETSTGVADAALIADWGRTRG